MCFFVFVFVFLTGVDDRLRGSWANWVLQTSTRSFSALGRYFHGALKKKRKVFECHTGFKGVYSFILKFFEFTLIDKTLRRPFSENHKAKLYFSLNVSVKNIPSTYCRLNREFKCQIEEKDRFHVQLQKHRRTLKRVFCTPNVFQNEL